MVEIATFVVGFLAGWLVQHIYSKQSSRELQRAASELRHLNEMILRGMEEANFITLNRNNEGRIVGIQFERNFRGEVKLSGSLEKKKIPKPE